MVNTFLKLTNQLNYLLKTKLLILEDNIEIIHLIVNHYLIDGLQNPNSVRVYSGDALNQVIVEFEYPFYPKLFDETTNDLNHAFISRNFEYKYFHDEHSKKSKIFISL
jgi:hypothetical protein